MFADNKIRYFIDDNIWYQGKKQPPRKVELLTVYPLIDNVSAFCIGADGNSYTLKLTEIFIGEDLP